MIKKVILKASTRSLLTKFKLKKFIKKGGKIQKIKAQPAAPTFKHADQEVARKSFKQTFGKLKEQQYHLTSADHLDFKPKLICEG